VKTAIAAALMATTVMSVSGAAHAGDLNTSTTSAGTVTDGRTGSTPPTQNLSNLSRNLRFVSKGVNAAVYLDRGLVTNGSSVTVSVRWGSNATTTTPYNNTYGNRFAFSFPLGDGSQRWEVINVVMTERTSAGQTFTYTTGRSVSIKAVWDVKLNPLAFTLLSDCDTVGNSEIELYFSHSGAYGEVSFSLSKGESHIVQEFAKTWTEVGVESDLRMPVYRFSEDDPWGAELGGTPKQELSDVRLLPGTSFQTSVQLTEARSQCRAQVDYFTSIVPHSYAV